MSTTIWERRDFVSAEVEDSLVLLNLDTLTYQALNTTAADVWALLETPKQEQELVEALCRKYDISEEKCAASVHQLMQTLAERDMVKRADASQAS
jgi:hypothetical protein